MKTAVIKVKKIPNKIEQDSRCASGRETFFKTNGKIANIPDKSPSLLNISNMAFFGSDSRLTLEFSRAERTAFYIIFRMMLDNEAIEASRCNELIYRRMIETIQRAVCFSLRRALSFNLSCFVFCEAAYC
ncbi:MAG: hypothetical protein WKG07_39945 [Hymenobacter sp.]